MVFKDGCFICLVESGHCRTLIFHLRHTLLFSVLKKKKKKASEHTFSFMDLISLCFLLQTGAAAQATMALPVGLFQQHLAALGATGQGNVTLQATGKLLSV